MEMLNGVLKSLQWCRYPRGNCTCTRGIGYTRLQERVEEGWGDPLIGERASTSDRGKDIVFYNDDGSYHSIVIEQNLCANDLCQLLAMKNRNAKSVHWSIIECWEDLGLERLLEDHEYVLAAFTDMQNFSHHARFKYAFRKDFSKYEFFHYPEQFFPSDMLDIEYENDEGDMDPTQLQNLVIREGQCPVIFSRVWVRSERKPSWSQTYMLLRGKKLFIGQKVQSMAKFMRSPKDRAITMISEDREISNHINLFADLSEFHVYTTLNARNQFQAPTAWGIVLRPSADNTADDHLRCLACDSEQVRTCWITAMRLAKYGKQLRENYRAFKNKQAEPINPKDYNSYSVPNESVRSRVAMDFTGAVGRIVDDPLEAKAIAAAEGYSWRRRWRSCSRAFAHPSTHFQTLEDGVHVTQPWFHNGMTRDQATALVTRHGSVDGVFLVRQSRSKPGCFVLTYKCGGKVLHAQINPILDPLRVHPVFSLDSGVTKFYDILQLVEFYQLNAGCLPTRLTHYVVQNASRTVESLTIAAQREDDQQGSPSGNRNNSSSESSN